MKILFMSDNFPPEGNAPATRLYEHAIRWVRDGHEVTVITCAPNFPEGKLFPGHRNQWRQVEHVDGIRVIRVKSYITANEGLLRRTLDYVSFMIMGFLMGLLEKRPSVVVATSPQFFCALGGWMLALCKRRPFIFELRDLWPASIAAVGAMRKGYAITLLEKLELFLYRRAAAIVSVTESFREDLVARGIDSRKIHVVLNGVDLSRYEPRDRDIDLARQTGLEGKFVAGYIGTHGMAHALPKVLQAAEMLQDRPDIAFMFAGSGAERAKVEKLVEERRLQNVQLIPRQPKERMPALWSLCHVALVPLMDTPVFATVIPSKIFESMGMGVPVLMSVPEGEATSIVRATQSGICVRPEDPRALAQAIIKLADDRDELARLGRCAREGARQFSRDKLAASMLGVMLECCERTPRAWRPR